MTDTSYRLHFNQVPSSLPLSRGVFSSCHGQIDALMSFVHKFVRAFIYSYEIIHYIFLVRFVSIKRGRFVICEGPNWLFSVRTRNDTLALPLQFQIRGHLSIM